MKKILDGTKKNLGSESQRVLNQMISENHLYEVESTRRVLNIFQFMNDSLSNSVG